MRDLSKILGFNVIPVKCLYFFVKMQIFSFYFFRGAFCEGRFAISRGDWGKNMGSLLALTFFSNMVIAYVNDRYKKPRLVLFVLLIGATVCFESMFFIDRFSTGIFWVMMTMYLFFETGVTPLLDNHCIQFLEHTPGTDVNAYGRQRLFGALAHTVSNFITETMCKLENNQFDFQPLQYIVPLMTIPGLITIFYVVRHYGSENKAREQKSGSETSATFYKQFKVLITNKDFLFFILIVFLNGITRSANGMYVPLYQLKVLILTGYPVSKRIPRPFSTVLNILNKNPASTATIFGTIVEVLFLFLSLNITRHFGLYWPLFFAQSAQLLRNLGYFLLPVDSKHKFAVTCMLETAKGINFSLTHASGVQIVNKIAPPYLKTTGQIIYAGAFFSLSSFVSGQIFGYVFNSLKEENERENAIKSFRMFFSLNVCINLLFLALFVIKYGLFDGRLPFKVFLGKKYNAGQEESEKLENHNKNDLNITKKEKSDLVDVK